MKTILSTCVLSLALCMVLGVAAQNSNSPYSQVDTVLISTATDGDYLVRKFVVTQMGATGYSLRYQINLSKFVSTLNGNSQELTELNAFVDQIMTDTLMHIRSVEITGYASPDGSVKFNETLAQNRALDFKNYLDQKYGFSKKFSVAIFSVADDWQMCSDLVSLSSLRDKQAVLAILNSKVAEPVKERRLRALPVVWNYLRTNILPPLRRVELTINYGDGAIVEQRTMISKPQVVPSPAAKPKCPCPCEIIDASITGIIVEMKDVESDY